MYRKIAKHLANLFLFFLGFHIGVPLFFSTLKVFGKLGTVDWWYDEQFC